MAKELESCLFTDWPVQVVGIDYTGRLVALPGRGGLALFELSQSNGISCVGKISRQSKWDCCAIEWNPHPSHQTHLASTSNKKIELWTWEDGKGRRLQDLRAHTRAVSCLNWSRFDPRLLATCSYDSYIYLWDLRDCKKPRPLSTVSGASHLKWNSLNSNLLATTHDGDLRIWDLRKGDTPVKYISAHLSKINGLDWSPIDGNMLLTCSLDKTVKLWDIFEDTRNAKGICDHRAPVWRAKYTPPGNAILTVPLSTASQRTINVPYLWNISSLKNPFQTFYGAMSILEFHWRFIEDSTPNTIMPSLDRLKSLLDNSSNVFIDIDKPSGYVTLPYISGITDALRRILQKQNIRVTSVTTKPLKTPQRMFPSPKHQIAPEQRTNTVYNIPCSDCPWSYVGETGRSEKCKELLKRLKHS